MLLRAFFDESGHHDDAKFFALNGFIASPRRWQQFDRAWRKALALAGLTSFHATKFFHGKKRLSPRKRVCLDQMLRAVEDCHLAPCGAIVSMDDFKSLTYGERCYLSGAFAGTEPQPQRSKPYYMAFHHCMAHAATLAPPGNRVQFVFAQQLEFGPQALELFQLAKEKMPSEVQAKIDKCTLEDVKNIGPPLEVADLLAHCWFAYKQYGDQNSEDRSSALDRLMTKKGLHRYDMEAFQMLLNRLTPEQLEAVRAFEISGGDE